MPGSPGCSSPTARRLRPGWLLRPAPVAPAVPLMGRRRMNQMGGQGHGTLGFRARDAGKALGIGEAEAAEAPAPEALKKEVDGPRAEDRGAGGRGRGRHRQASTGRAPSQAEKEKIILAVGNVAGVAKVEEELETPEPRGRAGVPHRGQGRHALEDRREDARQGRALSGDLRGEPADAERPDKIYPGQVLRIPANSPRRAVPGPCFASTRWTIWRGSPEAVERRGSIASQRRPASGAGGARCLGTLEPDRLAHAARVQLHRPEANPTASSRSMAEPRSRGRSDGAVLVWRHLHRDVAAGLEIRAMDSPPVDERMQLSLHVKRGAGRGGLGRSGSRPWRTSGPSRPRCRWRTAGARARSTEQLAEPPPGGSPTGRRSTFQLKSGPRDKAGHAELGASTAPRSPARRTCSAGWGSAPRTRSPTCCRTGSRRRWRCSPGRRRGS